MALSLGRVRLRQHYGRVAGIYSVHVGGSMANPAFADVLHVIGDGGRRYNLRGGRIYQPGQRLIEKALLSKRRAGGGSWGVNSRLAERPHLQLGRESRRCIGGPNLLLVGALPQR